MLSYGKYYLVKGHVQGVGYRQFVKQTASQLQINGWVRNLDVSSENTPKTNIMLRYQIETTLYHTIL